ncbi:hypothetical protein Nepgr_026722 [Nepenthes gracilis]|uniref:Uncharacterized protein n=1 Tax=Nepenthes gracilis TaxID=150966 RepID=A0AAD3T8W4_NEPGR|nr:hypothetical protein Nepgr_026722 [Nepenthes gracilis]
MELRSGPFSFLDLPSDDGDNRFDGISWLLLHLSILRHTFGEKKHGEVFAAARFRRYLLWRRIAPHAFIFLLFPLFSAASLQFDPLH